MNLDHLFTRPDWADGPIVAEEEQTPAYSREWETLNKEKRRRLFRLYNSATRNLDRGMMRTAAACLLWLIEEQRADAVYVSVNVSPRLLKNKNATFRKWRQQEAHWARLHVCEIGVGEVLVPLRYLSKLACISILSHPGVPIENVRTRQGQPVKLIKGNLEDELKLILYPYQVQEAVSRWLPR